MKNVEVAVPATLETFDEAGYLSLNPDVAKAVASRHFGSGLEHFRLYGHAEGRMQNDCEAVAAVRKAKLPQLRSVLRKDITHQWDGDVVNFLTDEVRAAARIVETENVSGNPYPPEVIALIESCPEGLVLDCGAGNRGTYYSNVANFEIVDYPSTDVLGVGEELPFTDGAFDGVISIAVLEHVRDPFRCASEIIRVLKPGGRLICYAPFQSTLHGYPHHYFNMSHQGLRSLFEDKLSIDDHLVLDSVLPIWNLSTLVSSWADGLPPSVRESFLEMSLRDIAVDPMTLIKEPFVRELPVEKNFELASGTVLFASKRG